MFQNLENVFKMNIEPKNGKNLHFELKTNQKFFLNHTKVFKNV